MPGVRTGAWWIMGSDRPELVKVLPSNEPDLYRIVCVERGDHQFEVRAETTPQLREEISKDLRAMGRTDPLVTKKRGAWVVCRRRNPQVLERGR